MKLYKQTVYIPNNEEWDIDSTDYTLSNTEGEYIQNLEKQEGYFLTEEQLKQLLEDYTNIIVENTKTARDFKNPFLSPRIVVAKESITSQLEPFLKEIL